MVCCSFIVSTSDNSVALNPEPIVSEIVPVNVTVSKHKDVTTVDFSYSTVDSPAAYGQLFTLFNNTKIYQASSLDGTIGTLGSQLKACIINFSDCATITDGFIGHLELLSYSSGSSLSCKLTIIRAGV